jgi:uncharacterized damage-inducible protein DinB
MNIQKITTRFLQYNHWANERITSWLLTLSRETLYEKTASSFGTIDRTVQHILSAEMYWHAVIVKGEINNFNQAARENAVEEVIADLVASSQKLLNDLSSFNEQQLFEVITTSDSKQSRYEYILHVVNHGSYHRGQIVTLCRMLDVTVEVPVTDYDGYLWWIENS